MKILTYLRGGYNAPKMRFITTEQSRWGTTIKAVVVGKRVVFPLRSDEIFKQKSGRKTYDVNIQKGTLVYLDTMDQKNEYLLMVLKENIYGGHEYLYTDESFLSKHLYK